MNEITIPCTVGVLTKNSGATLARALESVKHFSDIVICDGGSSDNTLDIAKRYGARIIEQDKKFLDPQGRIADFAAVRNQTLDAAKEQWFLFLDSDEYISKELESEIRRITLERSEGVFTVYRRYMHRGEEVMCSTTYPNPNRRLFARASVTGFIKKVDERIAFKDGVVPEDIYGALYVPVDGTQGPSPSKTAYYVGLHIEQLKVSSKSFYKDFFKIVYRNSAVSMLYFLRLIMIYLRCRKKKMPLRIELNRHLYHIRFIAAMWRRRREFRRYKA
ncbi:MAG: glycosyltransferase [Candidatus Azambacteria bacterium]|nr:glycosyltransferase [Candidatus Azambacteria bacterium]